MQLALLKVARGPAFGMKEPDEDTRPRLLDKMATALRCVVVGESHKLKRHVCGSVQAIVCKKSADVLDRVSREARGGWHAIVAHLKCEAEEAAAVEAAADAGPGGRAAAVAAEGEGEDEAAAAAAAAPLSGIDQLDRDCAALAARAPANSVIILVLQPSTDEATKLVKQRKACQDTRSTSVWTHEKEQQLKAAVRKTQLSKIYVHVVPSRAP